MTQLTKEEETQNLARRIYLLLASLFVAALITCNLIANKFIALDLGFKTFVISAGVLPYPITFLFTDILSEIYGRRRTAEVVISGFAVSLFVLFLLWLGSVFPSIAGSPVQDSDYNTVFQNSWRVIGASMIAYLSAQLVDVRLFHFWKKVTKGKMLWVRNNFSTIASQLVDTTLVVGVIFWGLKPFGDILPMIFDGWLFKVLCALFDTLLIYPIVFGFRKLFNLKVGEEIKI
ncbi:MAG: queuosine precursor transporter [Schleiferiaceae bacterium]|nr:queuosine precursor transporter [Schleiferiaceae bacterium]